MKKYLFPLVVVIIILTGSCEKVTLGPGTEVPENISFSGEIQPIFNKNCISCHGGSRSPDLRENNSYNALMNGGYINTSDPENSVIYKKLTGSHSSRASATEKLFILEWIRQGAKNN